SSASEAARPLASRTKKRAVWFIVWGAKAATACALSLTKRPADWQSLLKKLRQFSNTVRTPPACSVFGQHSRGVRTETGLACSVFWRALQRSAYRSACVLSFWTALQRSAYRSSLNHQHDFAETVV